MLLAAALLLLPGNRHVDGHYVWVLEKTTAAPAVVPGGLRAAVQDAAAAGGGSLVTYAVGPRAVRLGPVPLAVEQLGATIADPARRAAAVDGRLTDLAGEVDAVSVGTDGYSMYAALQVLADEAHRADGPIEAWLSTTVLTGSVDPMRLPTLTAADPASVVAEIVRGPVGRLRLDGVTLHPVLLAPIGAGQPPLSPSDEAWRADFVVALGTALGASVTPPMRSDTGAPAWSHAAAVAPVVPMPSLTPTTQCGRAGRCVIDTVTFAPDSDRLLDEQGARRSVSDFVAALPTDPVRIRVAGYTAAVGDAAGSRRLSAARAAVIAGLLQQAGVDPGTCDVIGLGFDERADTTRPARDPAQRAVVLSVSPS